MDIIKQIVKSGDTAGLFFIAIAIIVGVFKFYGLMAGITDSEEEREKYDLDYMGKCFGIFIGIGGLGMFFAPFICRYFDIMNYYHYFKAIILFTPVAVMFLYVYVIKKDRIFRRFLKKKEFSARH